MICYWFLFAKLLNKNEQIAKSIKKMILGKAVTFTMDFCNLVA